MDEKNFKDLENRLKDLERMLSGVSQERLGGQGYFRGPVADPMPPWSPPWSPPWQPWPPRLPKPPWPPWDPVLSFHGFPEISGSVPHVTLSEERKAKLTIKRIDLQINELKKMIEVLDLEKELLQEEFKIK